jgi:hypothetical protein
MDFDVIKYYKILVQEVSNKIIFEKSSKFNEEKPELGKFSCASVIKYISALNDGSISV